MIYVVTDSLSTYQNYLKEEALNPHQTIYVEGITQLQNLKEGEIHLVGRPCVRSGWPQIEAEVELLKAFLTVLDKRETELEPSEPVKLVEFKEKLEMPNPTEADLASPEFSAIWEVIKTWDINTPFYEGYCGGNGSHVMLILNSLKKYQSLKPTYLESEG